MADTAIQAICTRETSIGAAIANLTHDEREAGERFLAQFDALSAAEPVEVAGDQTVETDD